VSRRGAVDRDGNLAGTLHLEGTNYMDQRMRRWLGTHKRDDLRAYVEGWLASIAPNVEVTKLAIGDPLDFKKQFALDVGYRVPRYAVAADGSLDRVSRVGGSVSVKTPLLPPLPSSISRSAHTRSHLEYAKPSNVTRRSPYRRVSSRASSRRSQRRRAIMQRTRWSALATARPFKNTGECSSKHRTIPADAYPEFRSTIKQREITECKGSCSSERGDRDEERKPYLNLIMLFIGAALLLAAPALAQSNAASPALSGLPSYKTASRRAIRGATARSLRFAVHHARQR